MGALVPFGGVFPTLVLLNTEFLLKNCRSSLGGLSKCVFGKFNITKRFFRKFNIFMRKALFAPNQSELKYGTIESLRHSLAKCCLN